MFTTRTENTEKLWIAKKCRQFCIFHESRLDLTCVCRIRAPFPVPSTLNRNEENRRHELRFSSSS